jgi:diguanylate cyclase (GGDEF)-like protein/PAS domain S-box-containing protein
MIADSDVPRLYAELLNPARYDVVEASLLHFAAALVAGVVGVLIVRWERGSRPAQIFAVFCFLFMLWATGRAGTLNLKEPDMVLFLARRIYVLIMLALPALYHFIMVMLRLEKRRMNLIRLHWGVGIAIAFSSFATTSVIEGVERYPWGYEPVFGPLGVVSVFWVASMMLTAGLDAFRAWRESPRDRVEHRRITWFCAALVVLYFAFVEFMPGLGIEIVPLASVPTILFTLMTGYLTWRYGLVEVTPELAAQELAHRVRGALLMLDGEGVVQFANRQCEAILGLPDFRLLGRSARAVLGENFDAARLSALARADDRDVEKEWTHVNLATGQPRDLAMSVFAVRDAHEREVAYVCLARDVTEQRRLSLERRSGMLRDVMTGLPNRTLFLSLLDSALERRRADAGHGFAVCFVGLHRVRVINEDLGFAAGDRALVEVVRRLRAQVRPQDAVARVGGDEFAVLVRGMAQREEVHAYAERLRQAIRAPLQLADHELHLGASVGLATSERTYASGADLLRDASIAMHQARETPAGIEFIGARGIGGRRTRLEAELREALKAGQLAVFYQPVVDLNRQEVSGFEALVRWRHPERGIVKPDEFLPLAEDVGLIPDIDAFVLRRACADLLEFQRVTGNPALSVSVNMSEETLSQPGIASRVLEVVRASHLDPADLRVELLERVVELEPVQETLRQLRLHGFGLYIDDFGTRHSALSRLHQAPLTALKIDRSFVNAMSKGEGGEKVIRAILSLARNLGLEAIAEGACTADEVRCLHQAGCHRIQGFFFAEALPSDAALAWLLNPEGLLERFAILGSRRLDLSGVLAQA